MRHFYGVQFLNKSEKSFVIFHQLFQSAEETFFLQLFNNPEKMFKSFFCGAGTYFLKEIINKNQIRTVESRISLSLLPLLFL